MPLISIIMPCHNGAKYLNESIDSVIAQSFTDWELLVINDFSDDDSVKIINQYCSSDSRIKLLNTTFNTKHPATPRNVGINAAQGRYIAFLDCDDKWEPSKLKTQLEAFSKSDCAVVFSYYKKMDQHSNVHNGVIKSPDTVTYRMLLNGNCIGNLTGIYDTQKTGKVLQKEKHHEDYLMWLEILSKGNIAKNTRTVEAVYREATGSVSSSKLKSLRWTWKLYRNDLKLSVIRSAYHFMMYAAKGVIKKIK